MNLWVLLTDLNFIFFAIMNLMTNRSKRNSRSLSLTRYNFFFLLKLISEKEENDIIANESKTKLYEKIFYEITCK